jgi:hypothetical protein
MHHLRILLVGLAGAAAGWLIAIGVAFLFGFAGPGERALIAFVRFAPPAALIVAVVGSLAFVIIHNLEMAAR